MQPQAPLLAFGVAIALLVIFTHRANIARMRAGTEPRARRLWLFGRGRRPRKRAATRARRHSARAAPSRRLRRSSRACSRSCATASFTPAKSWRARSASRAAPCGKPRTRCAISARRWRPCAIAAIGCTVRASRWPRRAFAMRSLAQRAAIASSRLDVAWSSARRTRELIERPNPAPGRSKCCSRSSRPPAAVGAAARGSRHRAERCASR